MGTIPAPEKQMCQRAKLLFKHPVSVSDYRGKPAYRLSTKHSHNFNTEFIYAGFRTLRKMEFSVKKINTLLMLLKQIHLKKAQTNKPKSTNHTKWKTCLLIATTRKLASRKSVIVKNDFLL